MYGSFELRKKEEGRRKKEEGRRKKEEGRRKKEETQGFLKFLQSQIPHLKWC